MKPLTRAHPGRFRSQGTPGDRRDEAHNRPDGAENRPDDLENRPDEGRNRRDGPVLDSRHLSLAGLHTSVVAVARVRPGDQNRQPAQQSPSEPASLTAGLSFLQNGPGDRTIARRAHFLIRHSCRDLQPMSSCRGIVLARPVLYPHCSRSPPPVDREPAESISSPGTVRRSRTTSLGIRLPPAAPTVSPDRDFVRHLLNPV
jgi:hypothetical protein